MHGLAPFMLAVVGTLSAQPATAVSAATHRTAGIPATTASALPATLHIPPFKMRYRVLRDGWHLGTATFTLRPAGHGTWLFTSRARATGLASLFVHSTFSERSHFTLYEHHLRPLSYTYTDSGNSGHDEKIRFDWDTGLAIDTKGGKTRRFPLTPTVLGRLTMQLALSRRLAAGATLPPRWTFINGGELKHYRLVRKGKDLIATPAGDFHTIIIERRNLESGRTTTFWLSPRYGWLPVKMRQKEPGKATVTFVLDKLRWLH